MKYDLIVVGGGAAGFFGAIAAASNHPEMKIAIVEKSLKVLSKVRISGGGRCNVTHACFDPRQLVTHYPRGAKELLGAFHRFQPHDTINWFATHGVSLKTEEDGRIFPESDSSETIITCLQGAIKNLGIELKLGIATEKITHEELFRIHAKGENFEAEKLLLATGSSPQGHLFAQNMGHTITPLAPSLFTFNIPSSPLLDLAGISLPQVALAIEGSDLQESGALLLTHWGFSGPAVLRLSAWGARELQAREYRALLRVDWTGGVPSAMLRPKIREYKRQNAAQNISLEPFVSLPKNLAKRLLEIADIQAKRFSDLSSHQIEKLIQLLTAHTFPIEGKTTYKQEFVTCGGVALSEVNFKTMESRLCPGLHFAGEILDIDGITGGFNFQNAWTTGWIAGTTVFDSAK